MSDDEPLIIDSGPVVLQASFEQDNQEEIGDGGDRAGAGEQAA